MPINMLYVTQIICFDNKKQFKSYFKHKISKKKKCKITFEFPTEKIH